jgi:hypothetical protein
MTGYLVVQAVPDPGEVDVQDPLPVLGAGFMDQRPLAGDAGVVVREVQAAELRHGGAHGLLDVPAVGHIRPDEQRRRPGLADQIGGFLPFGPVDVDHRDRGTGPGEAQGHGSADAAAGAGNESSCHGSRLPQPTSLLVGSCR